jgi:hypothetical protein
MSDLDDFKHRFLRLVELREERDIDKAKAKTSENEYRSYEAELFEELQDSGFKGAIGFDFGGDTGTVKFSLRTTTYGKLIDKQVAMEALKREGLDHMIYEEAVRERRLNELVRDRLDAKAELPEGVDFYKRQGISISRQG